MGGGEEGGCNTRADPGFLKGKERCIFVFYIFNFNVFNPGVFWAGEKLLKTTASVCF